MAAPLYDPALTPDTLWQASLAIYAEPDMQKTLLARQDQQGLNVNLELLRLHLERAGTPLDTAWYAQLQTAIAPFNAHFTQRLRALRQTFASSTELPPESRQQLKQQLLAAELTLESEEQARLVRAYHQLGQSL